ncbi:MAG: hypothetical protein NTW96_01800 [Planctomycetia bacterium]|nr:hypothetical protein [Planctomycetia bacterium]
MRQLIHIPIIHSAADLGSLSDPVRARYEQVLGPDGWSQRQRAIDRFWVAIGGRVRRLRLEEKHARVYQDGLPVCGFEEKIVRELARAGSPNHQLIVELLDKGAELMGTEDPRLLIEEYELQKQAIPAAGLSDRQRREHRDRADRLLNARDEFIARRIDDTLADGETGILFLGASHRLDALGPTDVRVVELDDASERL